MSATINNAGLFARYLDEFDGTIKKSSSYPYIEGDVIVDASGEAAFVRYSPIEDDLFLVRQAGKNTADSIAELNQLEYPVTIVCRHGDPTTNIVVEQVTKFKVHGE